jgi:transposase-like protein
MRKQYTQAQRTALIELVMTHRTPPRAAAVQLGIPEATAYYWLKQARKAASPRTSTLVMTPPAQTFARLIRADTQSLTLRLGAATIELRTGFDAALLREVVAALTEDTP